MKIESTAVPLNFHTMPFSFLLSFCRNWFLVVFLGPCGQVSVDGHWFSNRFLTELTANSYDYDRIRTFYVQLCCCCCCSCRTALQFAGNVGGMQELITIFNWYLSCIVIIIIIGIFSSSVWLPIYKLLVVWRPCCIYALHRSITFRFVVFLLQFKMWFSSCGATTHLERRL